MKINVNLCISCGLRGWLQGPPVEPFRCEADGNSVPVKLPPASVVVEAAAFLREVSRVSWCICRHGEVVEDDIANEVVRVDLVAADDEVDKEEDGVDGDDEDDEALKESRRKRRGVKKTINKKRKSSETFAVMPPGRVMVVPPDQTKRILERDEPAPVRVTRQKAKMAVAMDHQESPLRMVSESSCKYVMSSKPKNRKGTGLERITKALGTKVPIQIAEGMKHPEKPLQDAKLASECGLVARSHMPVLPHFKAYKNTNLLEEYIGKVVANFEMNTNSKTIKTACKYILEKSSKNRRHQIKKKYYDMIASNKKEERKGEELSAIDLFKATPNSKKHGFSEPVKIAILEMEKRKDAPVPEGEEPKSPIEIVDELLKTKVKQSTVLRNVGLVSYGNKSSKASDVVATHVRDLEQKLERSELQAEVMKEEFAAIKMKSEEAEAAPRKNWSCCARSMKNKMSS
ncbi:hypothetical protein D1007_62223 [Hordeum vulgare]|nr:hypothetical protein D1007_62223 [Hordeum vulgare]